MLQHGERDSVGNRKAPPDSALFSRRNAAPIEVTDSDRDADDNTSILFLGRSISFDPNAVISHMLIPDLNAGFETALGAFCNFVGPWTTFSRRRSRLVF